MDDITSQLIDIALEKTKDDKFQLGVQENIVDPMVCYTKDKLKPFLLGFVAMNVVFLALLVVIVWNLLRNGRGLHAFSGLQTKVS